MDVRRSMLAAALTCLTACCLTGCVLAPAVSSVIHRDGPTTTPEPGNFTDSPDPGQTPIVPGETTDPRNPGGEASQSPQTPPRDDQNQLEPPRSSDMPAPTKDDASPGDQNQPPSSPRTPPTDGGLHNTPNQPKPKPNPDPQEKSEDSEPDTPSVPNDDNGTSDEPQGDNEQSSTVEETTE